MDAANSTLLNTTSAVTPYFVIKSSLDIVANSFFFLQNLTFLILWIINRKEQILRSRLLNPLIYNLTQSILGIFFAVVGVITLVSALYYNDTSESEGIKVAYVIVYAVSTIVGCFNLVAFGMQAVRYIIWRNLNELQTRYMLFLMNKRLSPRESSKYLRDYGKANMTLSHVFKFLSSRAVHLITLAVLFLFLLAATATIAGLEIGLNVKIEPTLEDLLLYVIMLLTMIVIIIAFVIDVILNRKQLCNAKCCCNAASFFVTGDPFLFRLDMLTAIFGFAMFFVGSIIFSLMYLYDDKSIEYATFGITGYVISYVALAIYNNALGAGSIFASIIITKLRAKKQPVLTLAQQDSALHNCLRDEKLLPLFQMFIANEFSAENMACWTLIQKYKKADAVHREIMLCDILDDFVRPGGIMEVNLSSAIRASYMALMPSKKATMKLVPSVTRLNASPTEASPGLARGSGAPPVVIPGMKKLVLNFEDDTLLSDLEKAVLMNLFDSFQRFCKTTEYTQFMAMQSLQQKELEQMTSAKQFIM